MSKLQQLAKADKARIRVLGTEWAFYGQATKWIAPKKGWNGKDDPADKAAHAYRVVEDAIFNTVHHIGGPDKVLYWSPRVRGVLIAKYRDAHRLEGAERQWCLMVMAEALRLDWDRTAIVEAA